VGAPDDTVIRRAEPRDVPALGRLGASLMRLHHAFDERRFLPPGDHPERGYAAFLETQMSATGTLVLVAERTPAGAPPEIVGYAYAAIEPLSWKELRDRAGFVHDLLVADEARGAGVGQRLLDAAVEWLRAQGMPRVVLWTAAQNDTARRLFETRGFTPTMVEMTLELGAPGKRR
jgi:GNAT superfamily N-acetyltransferase